ncbi:YbaB/EbfC family nucleoid-associated protein [Winogradskya humida]|uniref:YbaB/EbfC DNA-binding family protein n=1 Tax=Winogradskya humida TaxID=113566 RepID=A0ABQ3ZYX4_9ACTN|nr:YbaB/EbfC family nucleoid-associated protein [Actinoplanes humidus]GIE23347.1 hypothetical protein Ahu01nite_064490 [Actinoplanes humidus]
MRDVDAAEDWLDSWVAGVNTQAERTAQLARQVAALSAKARSDDGTITVTVGASGQIVGLDLDDRAAERRNGAELSAEILKVMRAAQTRLTEEVAEQVRETVGTDTETGRAVVDSFSRRFPEEPEPDEVRRDGR